MDYKLLSELFFAGIFIGSGVSLFIGHYFGRLNRAGRIAMLRGDIRKQQAAYLQRLADHRAKWQQWHAESVRESAQ
jgi:hypothetical protein